jgi:hypothetical protein
MERYGGGLVVLRRLEALMGRVAGCRFTTKGLIASCFGNDKTFYISLFIFAFPFSFLKIMIICAF